MPLVYISCALSFVFVFAFFNLKIWWCTFVFMTWVWFILKLQDSHFRLSFWALWWASHPSDKLFNDEIWTSSTLGFAPNQRTQQVPLCDLSEFGPGTIFPGQAFSKWNFPQTKSPMLNIEDEHVLTFGCDVDVELYVEFAGVELNEDDASTSLCVYTDHFI